LRRVPQVPRLHQSCVRTDLTEKISPGNDLIYELTEIDRLFATGGLDASNLTHDTNQDAKGIQDIKT